MEPSPVAVFAFRRPGHLRRTLDALARCPEASLSRVTIFCDGPRSDSDRVAVEQVVEEAKRPRPFLSVDVVVHPENQGLSAAITTGVSKMLSQHESVIVIEDDIVTAPGFLRFMNDGLHRFATDERVISIHGYSYPTSPTEPFFVRGADCWGWATWRRGWALYEADGAALLRRLRAERLIDDFDFNGSYPYSRMLEDQIEGKNDSWAVRWYASAFLAERLTLYPGRTLVQNIGTDGTGTHGAWTGRFTDELAEAAPDLSTIEVSESDIARAAFESFFRGREERHEFAPLSSRIQMCIRGPIRRLGRRMLSAIRK